MTTDDTSKQTPQEFFQAIGNKVENLAPASNGAEDADDDQRAVEEIESLCMNCGENVRYLTLSISAQETTNTGIRELPDYS